MNSAFSAHSYFSFRFVGATFFFVSNYNKTFKKKPFFFLKINALTPFCERDRSGILFFLKK